jgi:2-iminobutanoate/2-iminopropanoate deaminase
MSEAVWVPGAWHSGAPYSPGLRRGPFLFISGAVPIDRDTGDTVGEDIGAQTAQVLGNLEAVLAAAGARLEDVVKTTVFLIDPGLAAGMNEVYAERFQAPRPARSTVVVGPLARPEFLLEIEAIAMPS